MKLIRTASAVVAEIDGVFHRLERVAWDSLINGGSVSAAVEREVAARGGSAVVAEEEIGEILPPIGYQEVWAAGVTYLRSRTARMQESQAAGGGSFYDKVYDAERPELFLKATPGRVVGPGGDVRIRGDSQWTVPEPELALVVDSAGEIVGYTIGNDVSSRDIEGENPLYLPQAKFYDGACALGPCLLVGAEPLPGDTAIEIEVVRDGRVAYQDGTALRQMKRRPEELVEYLYRETSFPTGCVLLTGTGVVPPDSFSLRSADVVRITIAPIGTLVNTVA